jgi:S1-C subfamily serine protease
LLFCAPKLYNATPSFLSPILAVLGAFLLLAAPMALAQSPVSEDLIPDGIVKVRAIHSHPDYASPWQSKSAHTVTGSGAVIHGNRILTNAHVTQDETMIEVMHENGSRAYSANLLQICHTCDLALLTVEDESFFDGVKPLKIGALPELQSRVNVFGFPEGGESLSVTSGIVSRIEVGVYVHSMQPLLRVQIDAAINAGNSGGPVISNDRIVGIAMQALNRSENIGYMVPPPVINHFLADVEDGHFDGFPELGIAVQPLENEAFRTELGLDDKQGGILVIGVSKTGSGSELLYPGDILLSFDDHAIDRRGNVELREGLRIDATHVEISKQVGETLEVEILRDGSKKKLPIEMRKAAPLVARLGEAPGPLYYTFGGVVFQVVTDSYLKSFLSYPPYELVRYRDSLAGGPYRTTLSSEIANEREEIVVISSLLADEVNRGYENFSNSILSSVNGTPIRSLAHLIEEVESSEAPYLRLLLENGAVMIFDTAELRERNPLILEKYNVYRDRTVAP